MTTIQKHVQDLIYFYLKTNYNEYIKEKNIDHIPDNEIKDVVNKLYSDRKEHLKSFVKNGLITVLKHEYPGDLVVLNIFTEIFQNDDYCKKRIIAEIRLYQQKRIQGKVDHNILIK